MKYRQLGSSDVQVSAVILGTWAIGGWLWGGTDDDKAVAAIHKAIDVGVTSIDTAPIYGFGHSERIVGQAVAGRRDRVQLLTKYCLRWDCEEGESYFESTDGEGIPRKVYRNARKASVIAECERSLERLGTDRIDLYQCHWRDHTVPIAEPMEAMVKLIKDGKVRAAGVSNFTTEEIDACCDVLPLASDQPPYSMINRGIEDDVLGHCRRRGVGVIVYSPLQLGILSGKVTMGRRFPDDDLRASSPYYRADNRRKIIDLLDAMRPIAEAHQATLAQIVINWTINRPGITAALVGARNPDQAAENAGAADIRLNDEESQRIDSLLDGLTLDV